MSRAISEHEARHILAAAVAVERIAPARYKDAEVSIKISATEGEVIVEVGDVIADPRNLELSQQVAALAAVGPAARADDALDLLQAKQWDAIVEAGDLSRADVELIARSALPDPSLAAAHAVAGVQALQARLGLAGFLKFAKTLRDSCNQAFNTWRLDELVPQSAARSAVREAAERLDDLLHPNTALKRIKARTEAERLVQEGKQ
ncbi:hypothetical protein [Alloyangia pacifica]|uniref:Uncharacterized protein n=1 Tax=Alloyangia pacifica TaxID=311180 RepID=A0A1I6PR97_9RHOB|nr:hypothetical protein [Alloyangia pacifica]SDG33704.1 hypothetical protein SAMN04488245_102413 [Alloyangia pacifica]SFS42721.1 hypothetical protein SAMN04488050_101714 [Alloyangia pacifica]